MLWIKALHIAFMVTWFAGLFYLPRLFVYHAMTTDERLASLETHIHHLLGDVGDLCKSVDALERHITVLTTQRDEAKERLGRWKTGAVSLLGALALAGFLWIAKIAMIVQVNTHLPPN